MILSIYFEKERDADVWGMNISRKGNIQYKYPKAKRPYIGIILEKLKGGVG